MRLLWCEIKKIWRWQLVLVIAAISVMYAYLFLEYYLPVVKDDFRGNYWGQLSASVDLLDRFGSELDAGERVEADVMLNEWFEQLTPWIASYPIYAEKGIHTAADLRDCYEYKGDFEGKEDDSDYYTTLISPLFDREGGNETGHIMWKIQDLMYALRWYDLVGGNGVYASEIGGGQATALQKTRADALTGQEAYRNINCPLVLEQTTMYAKQSVIIILLSVAVLLLPFLVTDNTRNMAQMQWSTRSGRGTLKTQFLAAMLSAFMIITVETIVLAGLFLSFNREFMLFGGQLIYTGLGPAVVPWLDLTYTQYGIAIIVLCYVLSLGLAAILTLLSHKSQNPASMLLKAIPAYVAAAVVGNQVMNLCLTFGNGISRLTHIPCADALVCVVVFLTGCALCSCVYRRAKRMDMA